MRTFVSVVELHEYLAHHGQLVIATSPKSLQHLDVRLHALANRDFNPAHCVPGFEEHTLLGGISSQGSGVITRAEGEFVTLPLFTIQPEIIALGIKELTYDAPLHVGDLYRYVFTFQNMRKGKRMYKFECLIVCQKFDEETRAWICVTKWLWLPAYVDHAEQLGTAAVQCLQPKSYAWNVWRHAFPLFALLAIQRASRFGICVAVCTTLFVGLWHVEVRYGSLVAETQHSLSNGQPSCSSCAFTDAM